MKEHKLERACKVLTMARNRARKVGRLFRCACRAAGGAEDAYCRKIYENAEYARYLLDEALDEAEMLRTWAAVPNQTDGELMAAMEEAMLLADSCSAKTCLPNWWLLVAVRTEEGVFATLENGRSFITDAAPGKGREALDLGAVRSRGAHSAHALAAKALKYAKEHPENEE